MKKIFTTLILVGTVYCSGTNARTTDLNYKTPNFLQVKNADWQILKEADGITVYYQVIECNDYRQPGQPLGVLSPNKSILKLKIVNSGSSDQLIKLSKIVKTNGNDVFISVNAKVGETIIDSCNDSPQVILASSPNSGYPVSFKNFVDSFKLILN